MKTALDYLDELKDDAAVHIWPDDLAKCQTSECVVEVASVRLGSPDGKTVPLFSREQVAAALQWAASQQATGEWKSEYSAHIQRIEQPYTLAELREKIDSNEYGAELLLQHAMRLLGSSQQAAEGWELPPLRYATGVQAAIKAFACACAFGDDADARVAAALRLESEIESYARSAFVAQQSEPWRKRKEPHEGALVGEQIPPCHFSQIARQTGESASIVNGLNNLEQAALDAYNEHFYKCSPSCSVATWTSAWRKGIDWFNNMPGGQSVTAVIAEKQTHPPLAQGDSNGV